MAKTKTDRKTTTGAAPASTSRAESATVTTSDVARRAYGLYLGRGCQHGHDVDDWLQAERELRGADSKKGDPDR